MYLTLSTDMDFISLTLSVQDSLLRYLGFKSPTLSFLNKSPVWCFGFGGSLEIGLDLVTFKEFVFGLALSSLSLFSLRT